MDELPARMQAASAAQQTGDATKIAAANRRLIAVGLRALAHTVAALGDAQELLEDARVAAPLQDPPPLPYLAGGSDWGLDIALEVGYDSEAAFARAFKRIVGVPPAAWRRERQGPATGNPGVVSPNASKK